ncbi:MAG: adenylyltransferase/cytidyltransferase family protein [Candidatus Saccharibacteria bacterium]|nr:adenylyltransferase/cytidyltransferase family protein [Candidatus Saccharibacteria bacterium]
MKKYRIGYTQGVYDMFHIGHLNIIKRAKEQCDYLVVGVNSDDLVKEYKHKIPVICESDRIEIVRSIKEVDEAILANTLNKKELQSQIGFEAIFIGSDWKGSDRWSETEREMNDIGVDVVYLPHTDGISSTDLVKKIVEQGGYKLVEEVDVIN